MTETLESFVSRLIPLATAEAGRSSRRLPPERELCDQLDMSRGALREQLSTLERLGFIDRTQGRGTYLSTPSADFVRSYFAIARVFGHLTDADFAESREMIEQAVAEAAARKATSEQIDALRRQVDRLDDASRREDREAAFEADFAFHTQLLDMADNPVLQLIQDGLSHVLQSAIRSRRLHAAMVEPVQEDGVRRTDSVHREIVDAIASQDSDRARDAMREHFRSWSALDDQSRPDEN